MARQKDVNAEFKAKFAQRLDNLAKEYRDSKNKEIKVQNEIIEQKNKERRQKQKLSLSHMSDFNPESPQKMYSIQDFCDHIQDTYNVNFPYKNYYLYVNGSAFPEDFAVISALAKTFNVSYEYMIGISDIPNEVNEEIGKLIPLSSNAITTLRMITGNDETIAVLNAILDDYGAATSELMNLYSRVYQLYEFQQERPNNYEHNLEYINSLFQNKSITTELFINFISKYLYQSEESKFMKMYQDRLNYETYSTLHQDEEYKDIPDDSDQIDFSKVILTIEKVEE